MFRLLSAFCLTPWALEPSTLDLMAGVLVRWSAGDRLSDDQIRAAIGDAPQAAAQRREAAAAMGTSAGGGAVAVIPVYGVLTHRAHEAENTSRPLTSTERLTQAVRAAAADPQIGAIVLDVDSPGGSAFGVQELADTVFAARESKPVVAVANSIAASGAYWLASQATELVITPSGSVGSIGVITAHVDASAAYEKLGMKKSFITAGKFKAEGNDTGPLDDDARAHLQGMVDGYYSAFVKAVARGRGAGLEAVRSEAFGQGRMRLAKDAVQAGMADRIDTLENTIARYAKGRRKPGMSGAHAQRDISILEV